MSSDKKAKKVQKNKTAKKGGNDEENVVAKPVVAKPVAAKPVTFDPIDAVINKYREFGWTAFRAPKESLNDIIAHNQSKNNKFHFVQVVTKETIDNARHQGIAKNTFIQNAFSNSAIPIYAHVVTSVRRGVGEDGVRVLNANVTFENVNENARVIIGGRKAPTADTEKK